MSDKPGEPDDSPEQADDFAANESRSEGDPPDDSVVPSWRIPGLEAYLASVDSIYKQFGGLRGLSRIIEAATQPMLKIERSLFDMSQIPPLELNRSLLDFDQALEPIRQAIASMFDWSKLVKSIIDPTIFERVRELVARRMPPNWSQVEDWWRGTTFIAESGWAIVWLPRSEIVLALLDADPAGREAVLLRHGSVLVEDALACAEEIKHEELRFLGDCIAEITASISDGRHRAAQALSASVLTELLQGILGHKQLADAYQEYAEPWEEKSIQLLRFALITSTIPKALGRFFRDNGDPMPATFNRHAVAHGASPVQFTPLNALVGLLLVTALARELQDLYDEGLLTDDE